MLQNELIEKIHFINMPLEPAQIKPHYRAMRPVSAASQKYQLAADRKGAR